MPRRPDAPGPMRRIASATGSLSGRILKNGSGPRSPFLVERSKDALLHGLQTTRSPVLASLNSTLSPVSPEGLSQQGQRENTVSTNGSDDEQGFPYGSLGGPFYKVEHNLKTPPATPGFSLNFHEHVFSNPHDRAWSYMPQDEPLATPSLCSHGGSEVEFSVGPPAPGYVASQPPTPSFPPNIGPTYNLFSNGLSNAEYTFPDSYATSSVRSSPGQPKTKHFQFAPNVTPQDFNVKGEK